MCTRCLPAVIRLMAVLSGLALPASSAAGKQGSVFYPPELVARGRANVGRDPWAREVRDGMVRAAEPWTRMSDDQLWSLMFGNTIKRSWMVWSDGHCPACKQSVPMYSWEMAALDRPWKVRCPHCKELFPKNDFQAFHRSGLDEHGVFDPKRADRKLLFNAEHPDANDPKHSFGVDDGEGYVEGDKRWRFIGAYLIFGQWKQAIVGGISNLAAAYVVTGDKVYAHKAGVMLDRVADLYPTFDFGKEGVMYEGPPRSGYVSTWHDACVEVRQLAMAYDQVFGALDDKELVAFLADKAKQFGHDNAKQSCADIRRNVEDRILRDTLANRPKIESNYPMTDMSMVMLKTVLDWPTNREEVLKLLDEMLTTATAVDGVSGEKGLAGYSAIAPRTMAELLGCYARIEPGLLGEIYQRHPRLHDMYRFHIDTWCLGEYYPQSGDTGAFALKYNQYMGVSFSTNLGLGPSDFSFLWRLYELSGDKDFARVLYRANGDKVDGLPFDLFADDPKRIQDSVRQVIAEAGPEIEPPSVNKQQWCLAILRSGRGHDGRAVWLDYDAGERHGHMDGMNLGLFAKGLDLMPDFGYPPVQFGGWSSPRARWYTMTAAHNTVVVDGQNQQSASGKTTLWADGNCFHAIRASAAGLFQAKQYERTVVMSDISDVDFYLLDIFRVIGGTEHAKFTRSHFGTVTPSGLNPQSAEDFGHETQMRGFGTDPKPQPGWSVDWTVKDEFKYLPPGAEVHLRYTDLTTGAEASLAEAWVMKGQYASIDEAWIPCVMVRRRAREAPLSSTFVAMIEPYEQRASIDRIRRLELRTAPGETCPDSHVAVEVRLTDGRRDVLIATDAENPRATAPALGKAPTVVQTDNAIRLEGELCFVRWDKAGAIERIALARGRSLAVGELVVELQDASGFVEICFDGQRPRVAAGEAKDVRSIRVGNRSVFPP